MYPSLSSTAIQIIDDNIGYRNDNLYSGDDYTIEDVLNYEYNELGNEDILDYTNSQDGNDVLQSVVKHLHMTFPLTQPIYAYWFTIEDAVIELYNGNIEPITAFKLPSQFVIISDLDRDGILIASPTPKSKLAAHVVTL